MAPQWNFMEKRFHSLSGAMYSVIIMSFKGKGSTLESSTDLVPERTPSCGHGNGSTKEPFWLHLFFPVKV